MKMVMIAYSEALDNEIMELLKSNTIENFTKWTKVLGRGSSSGPHLLSHIWPKGNNVVLCCIQDETARDMMQSIRELRKTMGHEGVKAFSMPATDVS